MIDHINAGLFLVVQGSLYGQIVVIVAIVDDTLFNVLELVN